MGELVVLQRATPGSSFFLSKPILPVWPHPRTVTISIEQARAIDRDIRHLDQVIARCRDTKTISTILSTIYGADVSWELAAQRIGLWIRTGS